MCGIAGMVRLDEAPGPVSGPFFTRESAEAMAAPLAHRGPDGRGSWVSPTGRCVLGHTRLSVIDLETGDQPMGNEDGTVQVVYNGEIYNFAALRAELEAAGHRFRSRSDTEVLVHGWEEWGTSLPERVDGMFAFAVWDEGRGALLLARDRAGQKPLYVARMPGRLLFASEPKALLALPGVRGGLDPAALPFYLAYGYVPAPRSVHRGLEKLPPAHRLTVRGGRAGQPERYWRLDWTPRERSQEEAARGVRERVRGAVERRLVADVPLGAFLSGGVDSSIVVGVMSELTSEPVRTFALGFADDPGYDETAFARLAADRFGTRHTEFTVEADEVELVDALVASYDEPFGDSSAIPTWLVSRLTREHVTVALTGDGGDELFAGYPRFLGAVLAERVPAPVVAVGRALARMLPHHPDFRHPTRRAARFLEAAGLPADERTLRWIGFLPERLDELLLPEVAEEAGEALSDEVLLEPYRRVLRDHAGASPLARQLALNFATYLPEDLLVKTDRCSMAHGLELRSPFLDTALMEYAASLPDSHRIGRAGVRPRLKHVLKEAFVDLLPEAVVDRRKMGFGVPLPLWFRTRWKPFFEARVMADDARLWRWLRREPVEGLWREHQDGGADHGHALWALLTLESWLRGSGGRG